MRLSWKSVGKRVSTKYIEMLKNDPVWSNWRTKICRFSRLTRSMEVRRNLSFWCDIKTVIFSSSIVGRISQHSIPHCWQKVKLAPYLSPFGNCTCCLTYMTRRARVVRKNFHIDAISWKWTTFWSFVHVYYSWTGQNEDPKVLRNMTKWSLLDPFVRVYYSWTGQNRDPKINKKQQKTPKSDHF